MGENIFNRFDQAAAGDDGQVLWAARAPYRPDPEFDLMLIPRLPKGADWREDEAAVAALDRIEAEDWVASISREGKQPTAEARRRVDRSAGGGDPRHGRRRDAELADMAAENRYAVYFWGANTTKALHIGHLRNLAVGNAIAGALKQAGAAGREPQPDLRRRPQHGRGDGRRRHPRRRGRRPRRRREVRPLRRLLLRRLRHRQPQRRAAATTAPRTRSPASRPSTTTKPTR